MSTLVLYTPENRLLDLAALDDQDFALITSLHGRIGRDDRVLLCRRVSADDDGAAMFIRLRRGRYSAVHFRGAGCAVPHRISRESDEHRRQKDYWRRAAEDAGYRTSLEFRTGVGTVLDVAIEGPRRTGIEVRHSALDTTLAKSRTTRSFGAGWLPVWFLDSDHTPEWFHQVPSVGCNHLTWSSLPPRRSATAYGPSRFTAELCTTSNFGTCPAVTGRRRKRPCGDYHPKREPWRGLTVDDLAARIPAEKIVPMRDLRGDVHLVAPENLVLYRELTGLSGAYRPGGARTADDLAEPPGTPCSKCGVAAAGPGGVLCPDCLHRLRSTNWYG